MSFTTHPSALLHGESLPLLSGVAERRQLMQSVGGVDETLFLPFDRRMQSLPWERFLEELTEQQLLAADMNGDGRITSADAVALVRLLAGLV